MRMLTPADGQKFCCGILLQFDPDDSRMLDRPSGLVCGLALALLTGCFRCYVYINRKGGRVSLFRCLQMRSMLTSQGCWLAFITGCRQYVGRWCTKGAQHWMWCDGGGLPCSTSQHSPCRHCCYENLQGCGVCPRKGRLGGGGCGGGCRRGRWRRKRGSDKGIGGGRSADVEGPGALGGCQVDAPLRIDGRVESAHRCSQPLTLIQQSSGLAIVCIECVIIGIVGTDDPESRFAICGSRGGHGRVALGSSVRTPGR
mmetsp:Transcript_11347/g.34104  ORF Transcript_11347/g.34104 Transcript_11347/m.34104 type:complete len:256 (-) Transcript_11347:1639-2406(-)